MSFAYGVARKLGGQQRGQLQQREPSGQRIGNLRHKGWRDGAEQKKTPTSFAISIDSATQSLKHLRPFLRLVEYHQTIPADNFFPCKIQPQSISFLFKIEILTLEHVRYGCLSALTRTSKSDSRVRSQSFVKFPSYCPV